MAFVLRMMPRANAGVDRLFRFRDRIR